MDPHDRIARSLPVNKQTGMLLSRGTSFDFKSRRAGAHSKSKILTQKHPPAFNHLIGRALGKFTVVGLALNQPAGKSSLRWVVRCSCGRFEIRKQAAVTRPPDDSSVDCCSECRYIRAIKKRNFHDRFGRYPSNEEIDAQ